MQIKLPHNVNFIIERIYKHGFEAFIVGGCVRDSILGIIPNDYDITTDAKPNEIIEIFKEYKIIDNGIKHGTVGVIINKEVYEITTYRIESEYEDNRRPKEVEFTTNLIEDLQRRDFTINAMAYNDKHGLIDEFNGTEDMNERKIKTVGNPDERFNEDGLRIIRAIRFSSKLNFNIDKETLRSIYLNANLIKNISIERITEEISKILISENPEKIITLEDTKILEHLGIYNKFDKNILQGIKEEISILVMCSNNVEIRLLMLEYLIINKLKSNMNYIDDNIIEYYKINIQPNNIVNKLRYPNNTINYCNKLIEYMIIDELNLDIIEIKTMLNKIGVDNLMQILNLKKLYCKYMLENNKDIKQASQRYELLDKHIKSVSDVIQNKECYSIKQLKIDGNYLKKLGYTGIEIGKMLNYLLEEVIRDPYINNEKDLVELLK